MKNDLVYFIHDHQAGISSFAQGKADERHRNAKFVAVGALVPLSYGRLGRSWLHAQELSSLAQELVGNSNDTRALELFWKKYKRDEGSTPSSPTAKRNSITFGLKRKRGLSVDTMHDLKLGAAGIKNHPALYMPDFLDSFGPLIFPLYRAALLRKRMLLLSHPPVQHNCNVVYILSVLSSIPQPASEVLQPDAEPLIRPHPLFSIGIPDIPTLSTYDSKSGWIATTTDDILGEKHQLWDLIIELSPGGQGLRRRWPQLRTSDGKILKATQRDFRRYKLLCGELRRMRLARKRYRDSSERIDDDEYDDSHMPLMLSSTVLRECALPEETANGEEDVVEPVRWSEMAYHSFMWWASAGEEEAWEAEEIAADRRLLDDLSDIHEAMPHPSSSTDMGRDELYEAQETATVVTAYFRKMTTLIMQTLGDIVEEADDETEEGIEENAIAISSEDVRHMGLDIWSENDKDFVQGMVKLFFDREATVPESGLSMCGMKIC